MKKLLMSLILCLLPSVFFCSCDEEEIVWDCDYLGICLEVSVEDANGNNLLDPSFAGNILDTPISASYNENSNTVKLEAPEEVWYPFFYDWKEPYIDTDAEKPVIMIGILPFGYKGTHWDTVVLNLGDRTYNLKIKSEKTRKSTKKHPPEWKITYYLNDSVIDNPKPEFKIVIDD